MQSWEAMQPAANYDQHNNWYNSMFAAQIKTEPDTTPSPPLTVSSATSQLEQYLNMKHQERQQQTVLDSLTATNIMSPSSNSANGNNETLQHYYESNLQQQQCAQQHQSSQQQQHQQYQQQFQAAQQAAAQSQTTQMPLGFNPLTPPGLPNAVLPSMPHFYSNHSNVRQNPQILTPVSPTVQPHLAQTLCDSTEKIQAALTPRSTPPMDITPPKSPKSLSTQPSEQEKDQDAMSNSSEDLKYMVESEDDESIRMPIYNSHGKMKNYKCKSCGLVAITKVAFWEHARSHMKPDKILQCPKCPFVTELKHHLEYHIRKHKNLKPFQCDKCSYSCVNKSMLNSHRKSHSSVYQYRCADCDYATKYCHSFKLHLRKYDHKPGLVLDEEGMPNPSIIIDVYGTRRGPKSKSGGSGNTLKRHASSGSSSERQNNVAKIPALPNSSSTSQLSAALQGFPPSQHQVATSPAKSTSSSTSERTAPHQQNQQQQQDQKKHQQQQQQQQKQSHQQQPTPPPMQNILNPLATIMQQNRNMAFFPYWNLNLQMLAAQQQAAVLAQLSPGMRDTPIQHLQVHHSDSEERHSDGGENDEDDRKSVDSAMDLSQGTPTKEEEEEQPEQLSVQTPGVVMNLKLSEEIGGNNETPLISSASSSRRKGRVLKLETSSVGVLASPDVQTNDVHSSSADELMDTGIVAPSATSTPPTTNTNATSSSGNISTNSKTTSTNASPETTNSNTATTKTTSSNPVGAIYECKYCDIFFKDAVLYTIHMGYHSCDDVFKCNMCGEKCDGPVGLFVHMARNAHS